LWATMTESRGWAKGFSMTASASVEEG